ncbi:hypothetical protein BS78_05G130400 [Paspalum vaginatum]|nr:hypothetical protein BS78_05G130400 [Paspalum vaginatum]
MPAEECRTMSCVDIESILFVCCMDSYTKGCPIDETTLETWTLDSPQTDHWAWHKEAKLSLCVGDLLDGLPVFKDSRRLLIPRRPVISIQGGSVFTHPIITGFDQQEPGQGNQREATGLYKLSIDMYGGSATVLEGPAPIRPIRPASLYAELFAAGFSCYLDK